MGTLIIQWIEGEEVYRKVVEDKAPEVVLAEEKVAFENNSHFVETWYDDKKKAFGLILDCGDNCTWYYENEYTVQDSLVALANRLEGAVSLDEIPARVDELRKIIGRLNAGLGIGE